MRWLLGCSLATCSGGELAAQHLIRYDSQDWNIEVSVNGVPVLKEDRGGGTRPISVMVVNGVNKVEIAADPPDTDTDAFTILLVTADQKTGKETLLHAFAPVPTDTNFPIRKAFQFRATVPFSWAWEGGTNIVALTDQDRDQIWKQIEALSDSYKAKDVNAHVKLRSAALSDALKATTQSKAEIERSYAETITGIFNRKPYQVNLRDRADLSFEPHGRITVVSSKLPRPNDTVISINTSGPEASERDLRFSQKGIRTGGLNYSERELWFSKIRNKWEIVN